MTDNLSIAVHAFASQVFMSYSADEMLLLRQVNFSTGFREPQFSMELYIYIYIYIYICVYVCVNF